MLGQRRRRWANFKPTLFQCVMFAGIGGGVGCGIRACMRGGGRQERPGRELCPWGRREEGKMQNELCVCREMI